jgi:anaerobic magnesium-protoporphyrin IX monomethyl ester cyclase
MEQPVLALITLNGQRGIGPRYVAAACEAAGIETHLIHFKLFQSREVPRAESARLAAQGGQFVVRVHPRGDELIPFPQDVTDEEVGLLIDTLRRIRPTHVGVSFTSVDLDKALLVTDAVHCDLPGVPVMWGGIHATLNPETSIQRADMVCTGEGDEVVVEHLAAPERRDIAGLWFRDGEEITRNPIRPLISDLDRLPFPTYGGNEIAIEGDALLEETRDVAVAISRNYQIVTARGCPFSCSFCLHSNIRGLYPGQKYLRRRSVENVIRELEFRGAQGFFNSYIPFYDEVFVKDRDWIAEFVPEYGRRVGLPFGGYAHEAMSRLEMLRDLKEVGLLGTTLAFQSGSSRICKDIYQRHNNPDRMVALAEGIHDLGFKTTVYEGLTNTPFETEEDCRATLDLLLRLPTPFYLQMFKLAFFPGTRIESMPRLEHPLSEETFRFWNMLYLMTQSEHLSPDTIRSLAGDPHLRLQPELLEDLVAALFPDDTLAEMVEGMRERTATAQHERLHATAPEQPGSLRRVVNRIKRRALGR